MSKTRGLILFLLAALAFSCHHVASVYVSHPTVFDRRTLLPERHREVEWLETQLDAYKPETPSGLIDNRGYSSTTGWVTISDGLAAPAVATTADDDEPKLPTALPDPASIVATRVQRTNLELFESKRAYRDAVSSAIRQEMLDDSHDMRGFTMYELAFTVTIAPGSALDQQALVMLEVDRDDGSPTGKDGSSDCKEISPPRKEGSISDDEFLRALEITQRTLIGELLESLDLVRRIAITLESASPQRIAEWRSGIASGLAQLRTFDANNQQRDPPAWFVEAKLHEKGDRRELLRELLSNTDSYLDGATILQVVVPPEARRWGLAWATCLHAAQGVNQTLVEITGPSMNDGDWQSLHQALHPKQNGSENPNPEIAAEVDRFPLSGRSVDNFVRDNTVFSSLSSDSDDVKSAILEMNAQLAIQDAAVARLRASLATAVLEVEKTVKIRALVGGSTRDTISKGEPWILGVDPKELAQVVSSVTAQETLEDLGLGIGLDRGSADVQSLLRRIQREQLLAQSLLPMPRVVGFAFGSQRAGWILGPRMVVDEEGDLSRRQTTNTYAVSLRVAVPVGCTKLVLRGGRAWIRNDARWTGDVDGGKLMLDDGSVVTEIGKPADTKRLNGLDPLWQGESLTVSLPLDQDAFDEFVRTSGNNGAGPHVQSVEAELTDSAEKQSILIRGSQLWRNPQVYVGGRKADQVDVLPNMNGLLAVFEKGLGLRADALGYVLTVVTGSGSASASLRVPVENSARVAKFLGTLRTKYIVEKGDLEFEVDRLAIPAAFGSFALEFRAKGVSDAFAFDIAPPLRFGSAGTLLVPLPSVISALDSWKVKGDVAELEVAALVRPRPGAAPVEVEANGKRSTYTHFFKADAFKLELKPTEVSSAQLTAKVKLSAPSEALAKLVRSATSPKLLVENSNVTIKLAVLDVKDKPLEVIEFEVSELNTLFPPQTGQTEITLKLELKDPSVTIPTGPKLVLKKP